MTDYQIRTLSFRGHSYKICCLNRMEQDPSHFSFDDESSVRDRDWDIKPGDVVFDIGSAYGSYALTALACGAAFVFCVNPNQDESDTLTASALENGWDGKLRIYRGGVWSRRGWLRDTDLHFEPSDAVDDEEIGNRGEPGHFWATTLDYVNLLSFNTQRLDWMKLDVEGAEVEVLKGAEQTIKRFKPLILVEVHLFKDGTLGTKTTELLESYGYRKVSEHPYHAVAHALYEPA